jgi:hypothetical protein
MCGDLSLRCGTISGVSHARTSVAASLLLATTACVALAGCGRMPGDCVGRVRFDDTIYEPVCDVHVARTDHEDALGRADLVDCGTVKTAPVADTVHLDAVRGVDPSVAVVVRSGGWHGLYVVEGLKRSSWPPALVRVVRARR